jgi:hypothetical protein
MIAIALHNQLGLSGVRGCLVSQVEIGEFSDFLGANFVRLVLSSLGGEGSNVRWWGSSSGSTRNLAELHIPKLPGRTARGTQNLSQ